MVYQITVQKIHCSGCANLIKISLEDEFTNILVDQSSKTVEFTSNKDLSEVKEDLDKAFLELAENGYTYTNFITKD
jgi:copper chaperone CopZ